MWDFQYPINMWQISAVSLECLYNCLFPGEHAFCMKSTVNIKFMSISLLVSMEASCQKMQCCDSISTMKGIRTQGAGFCSIPGSFWQCPGTANSWQRVLCVSDLTRQHKDKGPHILKPSHNPIRSLSQLKCRFSAETNTIVTKSIVSITMNVVMTVVVFQLECSLSGFQQ